MKYNNKLRDSLLLDSNISMTPIIDLDETKKYNNPVFGLLLTYNFTGN